MTAPIFLFRNVKVTLTSNVATPIYGLVPATTYASLAAGTLPADISTVLLTVQCSNTTDIGTAKTPAVVNVSASIVNGTVTQSLVSNYPVIPNNAFDPLNGNLLMTAGDILQVQSSSTTGDIDVVVSLLEIANATTS